MHRECSGFDYRPYHLSSNRSKCVNGSTQTHHFPDYGAASNCRPAKNRLVIAASKFTLQRFFTMPLSRVF